MAPISNPTGPEAGQSPWLGIVKFLLLVVLFGLIFSSAGRWCVTASFAAAGSTGATY